MVIGMNGKDSRMRRVSKDIAYLELKERIISGDLEPDQNLIEEAIATELNISRTPLREALQRLEKEELVVRQSNGRLKVASISQKEVEEIFEIRSMLESLVVRNAARSAKQHHIRELAQIVDNFKHATEHEADKEITLYGSQFHAYLYQMSGHKTTINILNMLNDHIIRYRTFIPKHSKGRQGKALEEHQRILSYIAANDENGAEAAMREHIMNSLRSAIESIQKYEEEKAGDSA